jgi:CheY-like chemotaxis protein
LAAAPAKARSPPLTLSLSLAVTVARNGQEALDALQHNDEHKFDLILTDIMMPKVCFAPPHRFSWGMCGRTYSPSLPALSPPAEKSAI